MPLKVTIDIISPDGARSSHIQTLYIGRLDALVNFEQTSNYVVSDTLNGLYDNDAPFFTHKYSEGAETCVRKAIEARESRAFHLETFRPDK